MGRASYTPAMLVGSAIAAILVALSHLFLSQEARRLTSIVALLIFFAGVTIVPKIIRALRKQR